MTSPRLLDSEAVEQAKLAIRTYEFARAKNQPAVALKCLTLAIAALDTAQTVLKAEIGAGRGA